MKYPNETGVLRLCERAKNIFLRYMQEDMLL